MAQPNQSNEIEVLRQHVEDLFAAHAREHDLEQRALVLARENAARNLTLALDTMDKRLAGMNEFRATISDIASRTVTRTEWSTNHESLSEKTDTRFRAIERMVYMATGGAMLLGIVVNLVMYFVKPK